MAVKQQSLTFAKSLQLHLDTIGCLWSSALLSCDLQGNFFTDSNFAFIKKEQFPKTIQGQKSPEDLMKSKQGQGSAIAN